MLYYHYTDRAGLKGILKSRTIKQSPSGRYGEGVYLTNLHPKHGRKKIARNNWDGIWQKVEKGGKLEYAISVRLPDSRIRGFGSIFILTEDVYLDLTSYRLYSTRGDHHKLEREVRRKDHHNRVRLL